MKTIALIGYQGYAYVVYDCFFSQGQIVTAYTAPAVEKQNPFGLRYLGAADDTLVKEELQKFDYFVSIADNLLRRQTTEVLIPLLGQPVIALHKTAVLSRNIQSGEGVMIGPRVIVNSGAAIGHGVILQSGCIVDHESRTGDYVYVGAGALLGAGCFVEENSFIGAGAIVGASVKVGKNCTIGEGCVVKHDLEDGTVVM